MNKNRYTIALNDMSLDEKRLIILAFDEYSKMLLLAEIADGKIKGSEGGVGETELPDLKEILNAAVAERDKRKVLHKGAKEVLIIYTKVQEERSAHRFNSFMRNILPEETFAKMHRILE